jgi:predicted ArsR family transcriptional regulator
MPAGDLDRRLAALAALGEPLRRRLYHFVGRQDHPVSRDEAAEGTGVSRSAAAFHLDRLVDDGLLETEFRRLSGRGGPGAGRPAKLYRRAPGEISVSLPARRYDFAADLLAAAVTLASRTGSPVDTTVRDVARQRGERLAATVPCGDVLAAVDVLADEGYEPRVGGDGIVLANCPFHALAGRHGELVCGMNLALLDGFCGALPSAGLSAVLEPSDRHCCVRLVRTAGREPDGEGHDGGLRAATSPGARSPGARLPGPG